MKNMKYFPFERNKYFYGKLLTVDDFETEQRYMNDKRRVLNRFLYGTGVVCGLNVVPIDDMTISVEPGLALDFSGREIVVDTPAVKKLSMIDGFDSFIRSGDEKKYLYLCMDYKETEREPVHNVTGESGVEYNRYQEDYELTVTEREPSQTVLSDAVFYEHTSVIYMGKGVKITQTCPSYASCGDIFELKILVENMGQGQSIRFSYDLGLTCLEYAGENHLTVMFDEEKHQKEDRYEIIYRVKASSTKNAEGILELAKGSFHLAFGGREMEAAAAGKQAVKLISGKVSDEVRKNYYRSAMEDILRNNYQQSIYLAKIYVIRAGESYLIDAVEPMPFGQFVYNNVLADVMGKIGRTEDSLMVKDQADFGSSHGKQIEKSKSEEPAVTTGHVIFDLGLGGNTGQRFFSGDISHELGLGNVTIILGSCTGVRDEDSVIYGSPEIFTDEVPFRAELAAKADAKTGTFRIGLRLVEPTMNRYVRVNWTAIRDAKEKVHDVEETALLIRPDILYLKTRETFFLEPEFRGIAPTPVTWSIREENGGTIEPNGKYTAPNVPGIFEVSAASTRYENLRASIYVVVRDGE